MMQNRCLNEKVVKGEFKVSNRQGLHTIPSIELVKRAALFKSEVFLIYRNQTVNAKSMLGVLLLAATKGAKIGIEAEGEDAKEAVESLIDLAENNFLEGFPKAKH